MDHGTPRTLLKNIPGDAVHGRQSAPADAERTPRTLLKTIMTEPAKERASPKIQSPNTFDPRTAIKGFLTQVNNGKHEDLLRSPEFVGFDPQIDDQVLRLGRYRQTGALASSPYASPLPSDKYNKLATPRRRIQLAEQSEEELAQLLQPRPTSLGLFGWTLICLNALVVGGILLVLVVLARLIVEVHGRELVEFWSLYK